MSQEGHARLDDALALVTAGRLTEVTRRLVNIGSPTGQEAVLATDIASVLAGSGVNAWVQPLDHNAANAVASFGPDDGRSLLLYSPLDTVTAGNASEDIPWASAEMRPDMVAEASREHGWTVGLGAQNPKGHAACVLVAMQAVHEARLLLGGRLLAGFGCLGMPSNRRFPHLLDAHGAGCAALVAQMHPDAAVIAKSGWAVSSTEVGLAWFTVRVFGTHTYVGSRHLMPYRNAIGDAAHIITGVESWFATWAVESADDMNSPQGVVASISGGDERTAAFTADVCTFIVDLRLAPDVTGDGAEQAFTAAVADIADRIGATVEIERTVTIPGTATPTDSEIIRASTAAWESETGQSHRPTQGLSGATDANILRGAGIPTARVGLPKVAAPGVDVDFAYGMNAVDPEHQVALTRQLIRTAANYLGVAS